MFNDISTLDQARFKVSDLNKFKFTHDEEYWKLKKNKSLSVSSSNEFKEAYFDYFKKSLNLNITSDVEISMMLSSGFDSDLCTVNLKIL